MASIFDVAEYALDKLHSTTEPKLEQLCFYCQAWSLVWDDKPLFGEDFEAWTCGPICIELYERTNGKFVLKAGDVKSEGHKFNSDERETMDAVLDYYGYKEPYRLREQACAEEPWKIARGSCEPWEACSTVIKKEDMKKYYASLTDDDSQAQEETNHG